MFNRGFSNGFLQGNIHKNMFIDNSRDNSARYLAGKDGNHNDGGIEQAKKKIYNERSKIIRRVEKKIKHLKMVFSEFNKKVVLITGAAGGIGSALCRKFSKYNAKVYQTDIQHIDNPNFIQGDISDQEFIKKLVNPFKLIPAVIEFITFKWLLDILKGDKDVKKETPKEKKVIAKLVIFSFFLF